MMKKKKSPWKSFETGILGKHQSIQVPLEAYKSIGSQEVKHYVSFHLKSKPALITAIIILIKLLLHIENFHYY